MRCIKAVVSMQQKYRRGGIVMDSAGESPVEVVCILVLKTYIEVIPS